jgi:molybdopterin-guanine dinucleotide biosynthesis adapter protein
MRVFGIAGRSGSGKTTLLIKLIPCLAARGITISTIKQANSGFDVDKPGKDSYEHRAAGAREVMVASASRWALMHEYRDRPEFTMEELMARMSPVDLLLVEGFRAWPHPRLEVWREAVGKPPLFPDDPLVVALAGDRPAAGTNLPFYALDDVEAIGRLVLEQTGLSEWAGLSQGTAP